MTENVANLTRKRFEKFAKEFVDVYEKDGSFAAGAFAVKTLAKDQHVEAQPFVTEEFKSRGYTFRGSDDE